MAPGYEDYVVDHTALTYMRTRALAGPFLAALAAHPIKVFADAAAWKAHLIAPGFDARAVTPDPVRIATEGALRGAIRHHGLLPDTVVVSDGAGQFRVGTHALCWVHAERLVHAPIPATAAQRRAIAVTRTLIWWFYAEFGIGWGLSGFCPGPAVAALSTGSLAVAVFVLAMLAGMTGHRHMGRTEAVSKRGG